MIDDTTIPVYLIHGCGFLGRLTIKDYPLFMVEYCNGFVNCLKCNITLTTKNSMIVQDEIEEWVIHKKLIDYDIRKFTRNT